MPNLQKDEMISKLRKGSKVWNEYRRSFGSNWSLNPNDCNGATLTNAQLENADLSRLTFDGANLQGANLAGANLTQTRFSKANLQEANLKGANLSISSLSDANLQDVNLSYANLDHARLSNAQLQRADLSFANLTHAHMVKANLEQAKLVNTILSGANLNGANLSDTALLGTILKPAEKTWVPGSPVLIKTELNKAIFSRAMIVSSDLSRISAQKVTFNNAYFQDINFYQADLGSSNLTGARFKNCNLTAVNLSDANLQECDLRGANLKQAILTGANLTGAKLRPDQKFSMACETFSLNALKLFTWLKACGYLLMILMIGLTLAAGGGWLDHNIYQKLGGVSAAGCSHFFGGGWFTSIICFIGGYVILYLMGALLGIIVSAILDFLWIGGNIRFPTFKIYRRNRVFSALLVFSGIAALGGFYAEAFLTILEDYSHQTLAFFMTVLPVAAALKPPYSLGAWISSFLALALNLTLWVLIPAWLTVTGKVFNSKIKRKTK